jgi:hypothetical protein
VTPKPLFKTPGHLVKEWPEVFEDMYMNTMPISYLEIIRLEFTNGRIWEIDIKEQMSESHSQLIADKLLETFQEYRDEISKIDFKIDINKLKGDIKKSTKDIF